ncbi:hypothetical protein [Marinomonas transparens]|uniref:Uncharacterized protein n=1 Tax=Marinomonas transparens TaxID=2795388 RepID=A0A934N543_9GAMM|nr:hypothetical protein [Marinomonas transparens]MBJ7536651.1 hypothetical protein [Marinomonas transparens]
MGLLTESTLSDIGALVEAYDLANLKAHSAFMQGQADLASDFYQQAFALSVQLLTSQAITEEALKMSVYACLNCFDFCPVPSDSDARHYLVVTANELQAIVASKQSLAIRHGALIAYAEVARLCDCLVQHDASNTRSKMVVEQFRQCWQCYCSELISDQ